MVTNSSADNRRRHREVYLGALAGQLAQIAKIHSAHVKKVSVESGKGQPPGWSGEGDITLNAASLPDPTTVDGLTVWLGVLMHEVGHCQWSPEIDRFPAMLRKVYNMAEDQRQEHLVADRLPGVIDPFSIAVQNLILDGTPPSAGTWALIAGRRYLSPKVRKAAYDLAVAEKGAGWADKVDEVIADYKALTDPGFSDHEEAVELLKVLKSLLSAHESISIGCHAEGSDNPDVGGVPAEAAGQSGPGGDSSDSSDSSDSGESEGADGGDGGGDGEDGGEGDSEGEGSPKSSQSAGTRLRRTLEEALEEQADDAKSQLRKQAQTVLRRVREEVGPAILDKQPTTTAAPSADARLVERRLTAQLKPLLQAADAGLEQMTHQGRLRPERVAAGYRPEYAFDKWRLDQHDSVAAEIVVAVDVSGSMGSHMYELSEAIWVIRQVVAKTSSKLTVLLWDMNVTEFRPKVGRQVTILSARGGTDVGPVSQLATELFAESEAKRKWLIVMTDGHSSHDDKVPARFAALEKAGVAVTGLEYGQGNMKDWGISHVEKIERLTQIPELLGGMLRQVYRRTVA